MTSSPTTWAATKGPTSTGLKVSPSSRANVRVSAGSPARTRTHHPPRSATAASGGPGTGRLGAVGGPGDPQRGGQQAEEDARTEAIRSASRPGDCGIQPSGMTPWLARIGSDITG